MKKTTRILDNLFIGNIGDIPFAENLNYSILGCCKEPLHRQHARLQGASQEGYTGRSMGKEEPEYLYAERDHALYLNLIDARDMKYIPDEVINKGIDFIDKELDQGRRVLIVCNKAESRSPSIALMWMIKNKIYDYKIEFEEVIEDFIQYWYLNYNPSNGMRKYVAKFWEKCVNGKD